MPGQPHHAPPSNPWHTTYLVVAALSIGLLAVAWYASPQFLHRLGIVAPGIVVGMFTVTALLHWYDVAEGRSHWKG